jgi:hypothetical protein
MQLKRGTVRRLFQYLEEMIMTQRKMVAKDVIYFVYFIRELVFKRNCKFQIGPLIGRTYIH